MRNDRLTSLVQHVRSWTDDDRGVAAIEYAALLGLVVLGVAATLGAIGQNVTDATSSIANDLATDAGVVYVDRESSNADGLWSSNH